MPAKENPPYKLIATFYDDVCAGMDVMNRHSREKMLAGKLETVRSVCDVACGTGSTALEFARAGKRVFAVDNSPVFCRTVRARAKAEKLPVKVIREDMRRFRLPEQVDLVLCEFSSLNNLTRHEELLKVFESAFRALRPGGWFAFDVNSPLAQAEQVAGAHWMETRRFRLVMRGSVDPDGRSGTLDCEWFLPVKKLWRHVHESYVNIAWSDQEIRQALKAAGFEKTTMRDGMDVRPQRLAAKRGYDIYYRACKPLGAAR